MCHNRRADASGCNLLLLLQCQMLSSLAERHSNCSLHAIDMQGLQPIAVSVHSKQAQLDSSMFLSGHGTCVTATGTYSRALSTRPHLKICAKPSCLQMLQILP